MSLSAFTPLLQLPFHPTAPLLLWSHTCPIIPSSALPYYLKIFPPQFPSHTSHTSLYRDSTNERKHLILSFWVCIKITTVTFYSSFSVSTIKYKLSDSKIQDHRLTNKRKEKAKDQNTRIRQRLQGNMLKKRKKTDKRIKFSLEI